MLYYGIYAQKCIYQEQDMREISKLFKVLSDESRLRALNLIQERECCVCEVMEVMNISQSKASRICSALYNAGILKLRREGRWAYYSMATDGIPQYVNTILSGIKVFLNENRISVNERERLNNTKRAEIACTNTECKHLTVPAEG